MVVHGLLQHCCVPRIRGSCKFSARAAGAPNLAVWRCRKLQYERFHPTYLGCTLRFDHGWARKLIDAGRTGIGPTRCVVMPRVTAHPRL